MSKRVRLDEPSNTPTKKKGPKRGTAHRASKLNPEVIDRICALLEEGLPIDAVCDYIGISTMVFLEWRRRGEIYSHQDEVPKEFELYVELWIRHRKAAASYRLTRQRRLNDKNNRDWVRDLAILERRDRANYGKNDPVGGTAENYEPDARFM